MVTSPAHTHMHTRVYTALPVTKDAVLGPDSLLSWDSSEPDALC